MTCDLWLPWKQITIQNEFVVNFQCYDLIMYIYVHIYVYDIDFNNSIYTHAPTRFLSAVISLLLANEIIYIIQYYFQFDVQHDKTELIISNALIL